MTEAILSCVHANLPALEAVLDDIAAQGIRRIVSLGDIIGYGPNPRECLQLLFRAEVAIMGNHEEAVMFYGEDFNPKARASLEWTKAQLNSPDYERTETHDLWNFLAMMERIVEDGDVMYTHGSPRAPTREYVVPQDARHREKMQGIFERIQRVCFIGHSHVPHIHRSDQKHAFPDSVGGAIDLREMGNHKVLINVGSVSQPRDGRPGASYVIFDGSVVRFRRVLWE